MSWETEDRAHEGYVVCEFLDGVRSAGRWSARVPDDHVIVDVEYDGPPGEVHGEHYTSRPAAEVIGWRVMCHCRTGDAGDSPEGTGTWSSDLVARVPSPRLEDPAAGRLFVPDDDMIGVDEAHDELFVGIWRREHVDKEGALPAVTRARHALARAERDLDSAVEAARAAGKSWEAIGRAAGITRQSAHARWSPSEAEVAAAKRQVDNAIRDLAAAPLDQNTTPEMRRRLQSPDLAEAKAVLARARQDRAADTANGPAPTEGP